MISWLRAKQPGPRLESASAGTVGPASGYRQAGSCGLRSARRDSPARLSRSPRLRSRKAEAPMPDAAGRPVGASLGGVGHGFGVAGMGDPERQSEARLLSSDSLLGFSRLQDVTWYGAIKPSAPIATTMTRVSYFVSGSRPRRRSSSARATA